jgi:hypothetical protein
VLGNLIEMETIPLWKRGIFLYSAIVSVLALILFSIEGFYYVSSYHRRGKSETDELSKYGYQSIGNNDCDEADNLSDEDGTLSSFKSNYNIPAPSHLMDSPLGGRVLTYHDSGNNYFEISNPPPLPEPLQSMLTSSSSKSKYQSI